MSDDTENNEGYRHPAWPRRYGPAVETKLDARGINNRMAELAGWKWWPARGNSDRHVLAPTQADADAQPWGSETDALAQDINYVSDERRTLEVVHAWASADSRRPGAYLDACKRVLGWRDADILLMKQVERFMMELASMTTMQRCEAVLRAAGKWDDGR